MIMTGRTDNGKLRRITAVILAVLMIAVVVFSSFTIAFESEHNCEGEDCRICECIESCIAILNNLGVRLSSAVSAASVMLFLCAEAALVVSVFKKETPVTTKVRLNN